MKNFSYVFLLAIIFSAFDLYAQAYEHLKNPGKIGGQQVYVLPKATFLIQIQMVSIEHKPGYLLGSKDYRGTALDSISRMYGVDTAVYRAIKKKRTSIKTLTLAEDSLKVSTLAAPDYTKIFYVSSKAKWNKNQSVTFTYANDGILTQGESIVEDKTFDIIVKALSGVVSVASVFKAFSPAVPSNRLQIQALEDAIDEFKKLEKQTNYDIYKDIKSLYEKKYNKIFGEYFYTTTKTITTVKLYYTPNNDSVTTNKPDSLKTISVPLFRFNTAQAKIVVNRALKDQIWGKNLTFDAVTNKDFVISFIPVKDQRIVHQRSRSSQSTGIAYNVPARMELKLADPKSNIVIHEIVKVPQFGMVGHTNTRKEKLVFNLDPLTGELTKLSIEGKAVLTDQVANTATLATDAVKLLKGEDSDTQLEKEVKRLENEKKKRELLKDLDVVH